MDKERIFDRHKNLKLKSWGSRCSNLNVSSFAPSESQSRALINGRKSSKSRRATNRSPRHHIPICYCQATWPNDCYAKWQLSIYRELLLPFKSPFSICPFCAFICKDWVVSLEFLKWATGFGKNVGITSEKPDYSFTRAVRGRFDMKRSSMLLFTAVESQLSERYAGSQLSHTVRGENHPVAAVTTDSCICLFNIQIGGGHSSPSNNVID